MLNLLVPRKIANRAVKLCPIRHRSEAARHLRVFGLPHSTEKALRWYRLAVELRERRPVE